MMGVVEIKLFQKYALEFDRSYSQYIEFSNVESFDGYDKFTIVIWAKRYNTDLNHTIFRRDGSQYTGITIYLGGDDVSWAKGDVLFYYKNDYNSAHISYTGIVDTLLWNMYVFIIDQEMLKLDVYLNDMLVSSGKELCDNYTEITRKLDGPIRIGIVVSNFNGMDGLIGEVRVYNRALTESEIQYLYRGGHIEDGLVFWLYPDEDSVTLDSDGETVLSITEKINGYVGTAYNGVKLVDGKDAEYNPTGKHIVVVKKV